MLHSSTQQKSKTKGFLVSPYKTLSNGVVENIESVKFGGNVAFLCDLAHSFMTTTKQNKVRCLF